VLKELVCGKLAIGGGASTIVDALTPAGLNNRFGLACDGLLCTASGAAGGGGADCTMPGCPFGTPLAIANGGLSTCVGNTVALAPTGSVDLGTGEIDLALPLTSRVVLTGNDAQPCPACRMGTIGGPICAGTPQAPCAGVCDGSANQGAACTSINPSGLSRECPAPAATVSGNVCFQGPTPGKRCTGAADCGGGRCVQWLGDLPIVLSPLTTESVELVADASGLFCPRQALSQSGAFRSGLCVGGFADGSACDDASDCSGGTCRFGKICDGGSAARKPCAFSGECPDGHCVDVGTLVRVIRMRGRRMAPGCTLDTPRDVTLVSVFCIPLTSNILVNGAASLPGPGATSLPGTIVLRR
jgi:hypothetical protein